MLLKCDSITGTNPNKYQNKRTPIHQSGRTDNISNQAQWINFSTGRLIKSASNVLNVFHKKNMLKIIQRPTPGGEGDVKAEFVLDATGRFVLLLGELSVLADFQ